MPRNYLRLMPDFFERKAGGTDRRPPYPPAAVAALIGVFCLAEQQPQRGRFKSKRVLAVLLEDYGGKAYAKQVPFLIKQEDIVELEDGVLYVDGWDELQEGDLPVKERMEQWRARAGTGTSQSTAAKRTAQSRLRTKVFERDNYTCRYCGDTEYERKWLVLEHVVPDGPSTEENLVTACRSCNKRKGGRTPEEAGMQLLTPDTCNRLQFGSNTVTPSRGTRRADPGGEAVADSGGGGGSNSTPFHNGDDGDFEDIDPGFRERFGELVAALGKQPDYRMAMEFQQIAEDHDGDAIRAAIRACIAENKRPYPSYVRPHLPRLQPEKASPGVDVWSLFENLDEGES